jgi:hypothetical protein
MRKLSPNELCKFTSFTECFGFCQALFTVLEVLDILLMEVRKEEEEKREKPACAMTEAR